MLTTYRSSLLEQQLSREQVINWSGFTINSQGALPPLRKGYYTVVDQAIAGDAPKNFIRVYTYGEAKRANPRKWPAYIAKVGHKWYPNESITEHLLTRIGQLLGLPMAESLLVSAHGQVRFLSRYFLGRNQNLVHGAEIFAGCALRRAGMAKTTSIISPCSRKFTTPMSVSVQYYRLSVAPNFWKAFKRFSIVRSAY